VDLHQFSDWLSATPFSLAIQGKAWAIPAIQTVHILGLALVITAALILALRFAGSGLTAEALPQLAGRFTRLIWWLLLLVAASGILLIVAEPGRTITNPVFYVKMILLAVAILVTLWLAATARRIGEDPGALHKAVAAFSVLLWVGIIFCGRFIAYIESN
jgi:hypothetical protein